MQHLANVVSEVFEKIIAIPEDHSPIMVNISGCMGSGKSTYSAEIKSKLIDCGKTVLQVSEDDFLQPRAYRDDLNQIFYNEGQWTGKSYWEIHENWLRLDLMKQAVANLSQNKPISYHPYLRETGNYSLEKKTFKPLPYILFETSIFSELFDFVILIEVESSVLLERKLNRDKDVRNRQEIIDYHEKVQWPFWQRHIPKTPDLVIDNNDLDNPIIRAE